MWADRQQQRPWGFLLLTRIVLVHAAFSLAVLLPALLRSIDQGARGPGVAAAVGLVIALIGCCAMVAVAWQRSMPALAWLRLMLWAALLKVSLGLFGPPASALGPGLLNAAVLLVLALYWSRPVHARYLKALR